MWTELLPLVKLIKLSKSDFKLSISASSSYNSSIELIWVSLKRVEIKAGYNGCEIKIMVIISKPVLHMPLSIHLAQLPMPLLHLNKLKRIDELKQDRMSSGFYSSSGQKV